MIYADEVDVGIWGSSAKTFGQFDSSFLVKSALLVFLIVPSPWKRAGGTAASSYWSTFLGSTSRLLEKPPKQYLNVNCQPSILVVWRAFFMSANVDMVHFFIVSQKPFVDKVIEDHFAPVRNALHRFLNLM
jgi:hypothetical protein